MDVVARLRASRVEGDATYATIIETYGPGQAKDATVNASRLERMEGGKKVMPTGKIVATATATPRREEIVNWSSRLGMERGENSGLVVSSGTGGEVGENQVRACTLVSGSGNRRTETSQSPVSCDT